jgi:predicted transglutaminase-like cysteine proteinase
MFGRFARRSLFALLLLLPPILGPVSAFAQYQVDASEAASAQKSALAEPFGLDAVAVTRGGVFDKWNGVVAEIRTEREVLARCREVTLVCPPAARKFLAIVAEGREHQGRARIGLVNRAINLAIQPMSDLAQWGVADRWSAPLATLTTGRGDCEDYAIAKYVALQEAGVADDDLRLVIVHDLAIGQDHALVTARLDGKWMVLDNRRLVLLEDTDVPGVLPLFALDQGGVKEFATTAMAAAQATPPAPSAVGLF